MKGRKPAVKRQDGYWYNCIRTRRGWIGVVKQRAGDLTFKLHETYPVQDRQHAEDLAKQVIEAVKVRAAAWAAASEKQREAWRRAVPGQVRQEEVTDA